MQVFRITHPLFGQEFELLDRRHTWGEERVYGQDGQGRLKVFPLAWTSEAAVDPVVVIGAGRACFRVIELLELMRLLRQRTS